jgi:hypothetical protein
MDSDPVSSETLYKFLNITDIYPDIVTGTIEIPVQFNFSSPIDKYLFIVFSEGGHAMLNSYNQST